MGKSLHENPERRLDSWKEIASFFARDERTVRRWEKEQALPVHRIPGGAKGRVFAYESELREWLSTSQELATETRPQEAPPPEPVSPPRTVRKRSGLHLAEKWATVLAICAIAVTVLFTYRNSWITGHAPVTFRIPSLRRVNPSPEVEDLYLKGRYHWNRRTPDDLNRAVDYFTQAIVRDPGYAKAYAGLADSYNLLREYSAMPDSEAYPRALAAANKAVELDDNLAEAHISAAFVTFFWNWDAAGSEREFKRALVLNPNDARAHHWYASFLLTNGRGPEALVQIEIARRLDPTSVSILADKGLMLSAAGQTDAAITLLRQIRDTEPSFVSTHRYLSEIYFNRQDYDDYLSEWEKTAILISDQQELMLVRAAKSGFARAGIVREMLENTLRIQKQFYEKGSVPAYAMAATYARLGDNQKTFQYLETAYDKRENYLLYLATDMAFKNVCDEPEYRTLVERIGRNVRMPQETRAVAPGK
jgi:tetratricopeptide (TPR) repeat protein